MNGTRKPIWDSNPMMNSFTLSLVREDLYNFQNIEHPELIGDEEVWEYYLTRYLPENRSLLEENLSRELPGSIVVIMDNENFTTKGLGTSLRVRSNNLKCILDGFVECGESELRVFGDGENVRAEEKHENGYNKYLYRMLKKGMDCRPLLHAVMDAQGGEIPKELLEMYTISLYPIVEEIFQWKYR